MEKIPAAHLQIGFELGDEVLETVGSKWGGVEKKKCQMADYVARGLARDGGMGFRRLQNFSGVVGEDELK